MSYSSVESGLRGDMSLKCGVELEGEGKSRRTGISGK